MNDARVENPIRSRTLRRAEARLLGARLTAHRGSHIPRATRVALARGSDTWR